MTRNESETRAELIYPVLANAGWEVDSTTLYHTRASYHRWSYRDRGSARTLGDNPLYTGIRRTKEHVKKMAEKFTYKNNM